jgi:FtsX-like permease family
MNLKSGVEAVAISGMPLMRGIGTITGITLPGQGQQLTNVNFVTTGYFDLMKMRVVAGRPFQSTDKPDAKPQPVIVNEEFVRRFLQGRKAIAVRLARAGDREIVGVVNDSYYRSLRENPPPILYVSDFGPNAYPRPFVLYIRTRYSPEPMVEPIRRVLQSVDPKIPIYEASTIAVDIERSLWRERLVGKLATWFGTFTLLLSAIGIYGTLAYYVTQRRREFGLRRALGASVRHVIETVLRRISVVMISGLAGGFGVYFITARWLKTLFFGVRLADPISITTAVLLLMATAAAAAAIPIYRALHLDPASVLRHD